MIYGCGDKYEGEWRNDYPNGKGVFTTTHGLRYEGDWENGKVRSFLFFSSLFAFLINLFEYIYICVCCYEFCSSEFECG